MYVNVRVYLCVCTLRMFVCVRVYVFQDTYIVALAQNINI